MARNIPDNVSLDWSLLGEPLVAKCEELISDVALYASRPGGCWLTADKVREIKATLKQVEHTIAESRPFMVCSNNPNCKRGCRVCDGAGFLPKRLKEAVK